MPGKVKVRILAGRNLPVMDRSSDTTDAYAEVRLADTNFKTDVYRKSLNPLWNSEWFRFDVDDLELQDEPLQIRIMDYDTYSANDAIGKVYIDLNPLLMPQDDLGGNEQIQFSKRQGASVMSGWLPIFDTMYGVRGEVNVIVKVELFSDLNKFRQSSCGVQFFCTSGVPEGYRAQFVNGFVEELVVNDDPEYQWIDKIRTPRASNEARQLLFTKLSGAVRRKIGLKALELGGNAVVGYQQRFDLEGDTGIVVRGLGTAITLTKHNANEVSNAGFASMSHKDLSAKDSLESSDCFPDHEAIPSSTTTTISQNIPTKTTSVENGLNLRQSSESDTGCSPKGTTSVTGSAGSVETKPHNPLKHTNRPGITPEVLEMLEYPFITIIKFPPGFIINLGGFVSSRSVKLLDGLHQEDGDTRDVWWREIRQEVRSHARALGCNVVVGYSEDTVIWDDVIVLCASGTAAIADLHYMLDLESTGMFGPPFLPTQLKSRIPQMESAGADQSCEFAHIPYSEASLPFAVKMSKCAVCGKGKVPDVLFTTIEPLTGAQINGRGCLLQAKVVRLKKDLKGESNAKEMSDALPFLEYELHRQLYNKLKVRGMNALFGLKISLSFSGRAIIGLATATAVFLTALPVPAKPKILSSSHHFDDKQYLMRIQKRLEEKITSNIEYYGLNEGTAPASSSVISSESNESNANDESVGDGGKQDVDLSSGGEDTCVLEIDGSEDADILDSLMEQYPPEGVQVFSTEELVGVPLGHFVSRCQTFTQVWRGRMQPSSRELSAICQKLLASMCFKVRRLRPCLISNINFQAELDEENEIQMTIYGTAIALGHGGKTFVEWNEARALEKEKEEIFKLDSELSMSSVDSGKGTKKRSPNPSGEKWKFCSMTKDGHGINITPLTYVPGAKIERYLGNLNFFLIRETSSLREVGGLNCFIQSFVSEVFAIIRSHVATLGGNALVGYFMSQFVLSHSPHKNQSQCLIHIGGDVVQASYIVV